MQTALHFYFAILNIRSAPPLCHPEAFAEGSRPVILGTSHPAITLSLFFRDSSLTLRMTVALDEIRVSICPLKNNF